MLQDKISFESSLIFVFFISVTSKVIPVEDIINPKQSLVYFRMITDFSECIINPWF